MISEIWVWAWLPGDSQPTLAGLFRHKRVDRQQWIGQFVYGQSYLANPNALALDPLQLRLADRVYETRALQGFFGPLRDAMPDDWGQYVIDRQFGPAQSPTAYLLRSRGDQVGNLGFSQDRGTPAADPVLQDLAVIEPARQMILGLEDGRQFNEDLANIVRPNTALGGARPKLTIEHEGRQWLAKFPARNDRGAAVARVEAAMLDLASQCGIRAARARVVHDDVLLVERFDRARAPDAKGWRRDAFLSAQTVFHANTDVQAYATSGSYTRLAQEAARISEQVRSDRLELYRRMAFNCCISNTDDHERNHGFIAADTPGLYVLSPAYDLVPRRHATRRREHAMLIGDEGYVATRANLLSSAEHFGLSAPEAGEIVDHVQNTVAENWRSSLLEQGVSQVQCDELAACFQPLAASLADLPRPSATSIPRGG